MTCERSLSSQQEVSFAPALSSQGSEAGPDDHLPSTTSQTATDGADEDEVSEPENANSRASTDPEHKERKSNMASFDFLGTASCTKLVPAKSVFRRLKRRSLDLRSLGSTPSLQQAVVGERLRSLTKTGGPAAGLEAVPEEAPVVEVQDSQKSDEGQVVDYTSMKGEESAKQEKPELSPSGLQLSAERPIAASEAPRKRFTLPLPSSCRRRSCDGSVFSVCTLSDSEDSLSSAGYSESSGGCCQMIVPVRRSTSVGSRHSSTTALDAMFERVKSTAASSSCTTSTTAESSRASSPGHPRAGASGMRHTRKNAQHCNATKPTLAGAAKVLSQLCQEEEATLALEDRSSELLVQADPQDFSVGTARASLKPKQSFSFCFPEHLCGIPIENTSQSKSLVYKNSGARRRRSRRRADGL